MSVRCWAGCGEELMGDFERDNADLVMYCEKCKTKHIFIDAEHPKVKVMYAIKEDGTKLRTPIR